MIDTLKFGDVVSYKDGSGEFCILCPAPSTGNFASPKDYLAMDLAEDNVVFLDEKEVVKIDKMEEGANPCNPIFDSSIPLLSNVSIDSSGLQGIVIAVNPILLPIHFECEYLILSECGKTITAKSSDFTVLREL